MEFVPLLAMGTLVGKLIDFAKYLRDGDYNGAVTQVSVWVAGILVVLLAAQTDFAPTIAFGEASLAQMNLATQVFIGLLAASLFGYAYDVKKAVDHTDSAAVPPLTRLPSSPQGRARR